MTSNLSVLMKKFSIPFVFFAIGIAMVAIGFTTKQTSMWYLASLLSLLAGLVSLMFSGGFFKLMIGKIIGLLAGVSAVISLFFAYDSVVKTTEHQKRFDHSVLLIQQNLSDIRTAQKAYREKNGVFAHTWEELETFMNEGLVPEVQVEGVVPARKLTPEENTYIYKSNRPIDNNMSEYEAWVLSKNPTKFPEFSTFKRDTVLVSFNKRQFQNKSYLLRREKEGFGKLFIDSLKFIPYTKGKEKFNMTAMDSLAVGTEKLPVLEVRGKLPFPRIEGTKREEIFFGSLTAPELVGSWE
jgi:hypothetical protein